LKQEPKLELENQGGTAKITIALGNNTILQREVLFLWAIYFLQK
jgi:hypothetical protein